MPERVPPDAAELADLIRLHQPCVALTGAGCSAESGIPTFRGTQDFDSAQTAGVSTASGIPDFRSAGGIWERFDPYEVASIDAFHRDPARVWEFYALRLDVLADAEPNAAHRALASLEEAGLVRAVITQNVDRLHAAAGSREVIEVHGQVARARCLRCGTVVEGAALRALLPLPHCQGCGTVPKPDVVMFGELLPVAAFDRAAQLAREAQLLLVVGSSLEVWPVAGLPEETLAHGGKLAVVNRDPTSYDARAALVVHGSAGEVLAACAAALQGSDGSDS